MKIKNTIVIIIILIVAILLMWKLYSPAPAKSPHLENIPNPINTNDYAGTVSTTTSGQLLYTDSKTNFKFTFPQNWHLGSGAVGYGIFQLFNYDERTASPKDSYGANTKTNGISGGISSNNSYINTEYPEKTRKTEEIFIKNQTVTRQDVEFIDGTRVRIYFIPVPNKNKEYLGISIAGNPANFYVLDNLVKSLEWLK